MKRFWDFVELDGAEEPPGGSANMQRRHEAQPFANSAVKKASFRFSAGLSEEKGAIPGKGRRRCQRHKSPRQK